MRKIEQQMLDAIRDRKDWRSGNTEVQVTFFPHGDRNIERINVMLHGNHIAQVTHDLVTICDCGWQTPTTKSRLNALLHTLCGAGIYQRDHQWYGTAIEETDWEIDPNTRHSFVRG